MQNLSKAMLAGFVATLVLSALMVMKSMMGVMPELDIAAMISTMMGVPGMPMVGWGVHFMIGTILYGVAIAVLDPRLPGDSRIGHGVAIGALGWLAMMIMLMPLAGVGMFGMSLGMMAPVMTLVLHLIFGAVLGWVYGRSIQITQSTSRAQA